MGGVDAAAHRLGHGQLEVNVPPGVVEIVVVKVHRSVELRGDSEVLLLAPPKVAGHGPVGPVHGAPDVTPSGDVVDHVGRKIGGKGPGGPQGSVTDLGRRSVPSQAPQLFFRQCRGIDPRAVDLPVVLGLCNRLAVGQGRQVGGHRQWAVGALQGEGAGVLECDRTARLLWPHGDRQLVERHPSVIGIVGSGRKAPDSVPHRGAGGNGLGGGAVSHRNAK